MDGTLTWIMWLRELRGLADIDPWRGWYSGDEKERQHEGSYWKMDDLVFISIHGSGHRVARDDPHAGKWILEAFIENGDLE